MTKKTTSKKAAKKTPAKKTGAKQAVATVATPTVPVAPAAEQEPTKDQLQAAYQKAVKAYLNRPNVTGVDVGFRYKDGKRLNGFGVRVHVREKIKPEGLEADELLPQQIDGVAVDVIQAVYKPQAAMYRAEPEPVARKSRIDPIQPGISISHPSVSSGTLGAVVYDRTTGHRCILSNWHVMVGSVSAQPGDPIVQPGKKHGGRSPHDRIGTLKRFILDRHGDAAIAVLNGSRSVSGSQAESSIEVQVSRSVQPGEVVEKSGASTAVTRGLVEGSGIYTIDYSVGPVSIEGFKVVTEKDGNPDNLELSMGGDSGSIWYSPEDKAGVGLHFAGETGSHPSAEEAIACHLPSVLEHLNISLTPIGEVPPPPVEEAEPSLSPYAMTQDNNRLVIETISRLARVLEAVCLPRNPQ